MKLYNTLTRQTEEFDFTDKIKIYACGPTVYNFIHIGNARPICIFDVLRRYLKYKFGENSVVFVQNFTDVDDKIIRKANEENISVKELTDKYIKEYFTDAHGLNVLDSDIHPRVSENIDAIIGLIEKIIANGYAYEVNGDVYFAVKKFNEYGKLSGKNTANLLSGARVDVDEKKSDPLDFALWKAAKPGEPFWESPWGKGRPGWHIECSAMSMKFLGETIDIHCGGADLIFPHHENEICQSEAATGKPFSRFWLHNGFIDVNGEKMSKSKGNFFTVRDVVSGNCETADGKPVPVYSYETIRYMMLQAHYASPINYSEEVLKSCKNALDRLYTCRDSLLTAIENALETAAETDISQYNEKINSVLKNFENAMDDNLNTSVALAVLFDFVRDINTAVKNNDVSKSILQEYLLLFNKIINIFGLLYERKENEIPADVMEIVSKWEAARKEKNFSLADELKAKIAEMGYKVEVTRTGINIKKV